MGFSNCPEVLLSSEAKSGLYGPHTLVTLPIKLSLTAITRKETVAHPYTMYPLSPYNIQKPVYYIKQLRIKINVYHASSQVLTYTWA